MDLSNKKRKWYFAHDAISQAEIAARLVLHCDAPLFLPLALAVELCHRPYAWWEGLWELIHFKYDP